MANNEVTMFEAVNNERTELIKSVSIENLIRCRKAASEKLTQAFACLGEAYQLSVQAGVKRGISLNDIETAVRYTRYSDLSSESERDRIVSGLIKYMDKNIWSYLLEESNMKDLMDAEAREKWYDGLEKGSYPEVTAENIEQTFQALNNTKYEFLERGVLNVFKSLSWDYRTNLPVKFGRKIIMEGVVNSGSWSVGLRHGKRRDQLVDLDRFMRILDGEPVPEHRNDIATRLDDFIKSEKFSGKPFVDEYVSIKYYKKGSCHVTFLRPDLVERMNDILARHYPEALPPAA